MTVSIHAASLLYDLRLIRTLLSQHNAELWSTQATRRALRIVDEIIEVIENETLLGTSEHPSSPEAGLGAQ